MQRLLCLANWSREGRVGYRQGEGGRIGQHEKEQTHLFGYFCRKRWPQVPYHPVRPQLYLQTDQYGFYKTYLQSRNQATMPDTCLDRTFEKTGTCTLRQLLLTNGLASDKLEQEPIIAHLLGLTCSPASWEATLEIKKWIFEVFVAWAENMLAIPKKNGKNYQNQQSNTI